MKEKKPREQNKQTVGEKNYQKKKSIVVILQKKCTKSMDEK